MMELDCGFELETITNDDGDRTMYLKYPIDIDTGTGDVPVTFHVVEEHEGEVLLTDNGFTTRTVRGRDSDSEVQNGIVVE